jgi:hypothetical protein
MGNELQTTHGSPLAMAAEFIKKDSNIDVDKLAKLLEVQIAWEANEAKKAYVEAMAAFKANPPKIIKNRHVKFETRTGGVTEYCHASLDKVTATISEALSRHGLTAAWVTGQADGQVTVTCRITHIFGHSEETSLTSAPDNSGSKNPIQAIGSAVSYLQRYTLLALTGLATEGQDDDGAGTGKPKKEPEPVKLNKKQQEFIGKIGIVLDENLDGATVDKARLTECIIGVYQKKNEPIPESTKDDNGKVSQIATWLMGKTETMAYLKGEAA